MDCKFIIGFLTLHWNHMLLRVGWGKNVEKKGRDLTQSYDKSPYADRKSKTQRENTKTPPKTSITQRLRTDLGRSVWLTIATQLVWFINGIPDLAIFAIFWLCCRRGHPCFTNTCLATFVMLYMNMIYISQWLFGGNLKFYTISMFLHALKNFLNQKEFSSKHV